MANANPANVASLVLRRPVSTPLPPQTRVRSLRRDSGDQDSGAVGSPRGPRFWSRGSSGPTGNRGSEAAEVLIRERPLVPQSTAALKQDAVCRRLEKIPPSPIRGDDPPRQQMLRRALSGWPFQNTKTSHLRPIGLKLIEVETKKRNKLMKEFGLLEAGMKQEGRFGNDRKWRNASVSAESAFLSLQKIC